MPNYSFRDIDGNDMIEGDFGLFCSSGRMHYGMLCGKRFINEQGSLFNFSEACKLNDENLSDKQLESKKTVQVKYDKYYVVKKTKKKLPGIKAKDLEIGQAYISLNTEIYLYCGHGTVSYEYGSKKPEIETGFIYIKTGHCSFNDITNIDVGKEHIIKYILADMLFSRQMPGPIVCKTRKKFIAKSMYRSPIIEKNFEYSYSDNYRGCQPRWTEKDCNKLFKISID